jgi:hypothetical protein
LESGLQHLLKTLEYLLISLGPELVCCDQTHHLPGIRVLVVDDRVLEGSEEILLETEMRQFFLFQEVHRQLPQRIQRKEADIRVIMATHLSRQLHCLYETANSFGLPG